VRDRVSYGIWVHSRDVDFVRTLAAAGFDWLVLDAQHSGLDRASLLDLGRALGDAGHPFGVRVASADFTAIGVALDAGASTIIVPQVDTAEQAAAAVRACYYPPLGERSRGEFAQLRAAAQRSVEQANAEIVCGVMIESAAALGNVAEIAAVPGLDMLFVGPNDLALSLGIGLDEVAAGPLPVIGAAARANGLTLGAYAADVERVREFRAAGVEFLVAATDLSVVSVGASAVLGQLT
jgi:2-keto-3-deoxy-L-rhamnonate aldolase RhmA